MPPMHNYSYAKRAMADSWSTTTVKNAQKAHCATCSATKNEGKRHHLRDAARCRAMPLFHPRNAIGERPWKNKMQKKPKKKQQIFGGFKKNEQFCAWKSDEIIAVARKNSSWHWFSAKTMGATPPPHILTLREENHYHAKRGNQH